MNVQRIRTALKHVSRLPEIATCIRSVQGGWQLAATYSGLHQPHFPCLVRFRNGLTYRLEEYYDLETLWQIHFHHVYPLRPSDEVIVDAGANIGLFTCWAAARNPHARIVAVEPSERNFNRLREHVRLNRLDSRVTALPVALSATTGTVWLAECSSASQMRHVAPSESAGAEATPAVSLAELLERLPYDRIDFLKVDIEGSEYGALMSGPADQFQRIRRISVEYHLPPPGSGYSKDALIRHLSFCGFHAIVDRHPHAQYGMLDAARD
jgi:FkbM family methyltransferase